MEGHPYYDILKIVMICGMWYSCSASDNIIGKIILSDFPYPMTVSMCHLSVAAIFLGQIKKCMDVPKGRTINKYYWYTMILPLALGKFISSVASYMSIWKVSVSYAHTVKATLPMFTVVLSRIILGEKQTKQVYYTLVPIIAGVCITTATELSFDSFGLACSLFATICFSLQTIFTKKCLKDTSYHHLELLTFITRISTVLFLPIWLIFDFRRIYHDEIFLSSGKVMNILVLLITAGVLSMLHNVFAFTLLAIVSPVSYAVANATKRIVIIGGSLLILRNPVGPLNIVGMAVAVLGVLLYNKAKYDQRRKEILPYIHSAENIPTMAKGVNHLPHSKSDANMLLNGTSNGHLFSQNWEAKQENFTLIPLAEADKDKTVSSAAPRMPQTDLL